MNETNMTIITNLIATIAAFIAFMQWVTSERQRQKELFEMRYKFYNSLKKHFLSQHENCKPVYPYMLEEDVIAMANQALFLFDDEVASAVRLIGRYNISDDLFYTESLPQEMENLFLKKMRIEKNFSIYCAFVKIMLFFIPVCVRSFISKVFYHKILPSLKKGY